MRILLPIAALIFLANTMPAHAADPGPNTRFSGAVFLDLTHLEQSSQDSRGGSSGNDGDLKRLQLSLDHRFNDLWSVDVTTDSSYSRTGEHHFYWKKAYLQGAFSRLATLRLGSAGLPWIPFVEEWYGYRFVENTLVDRTKFGTSADWGVHLLGDDGRFDYQASIVNGGGYKHPARASGADFAARAGFQPIRSMVIAVGGYSGDLGKDTHGTPALHDAHRYDAMVAYSANGVRLGGEYFRASNWNNVLTPVTDSAGGWSLWSSYDFGPAAIFARYDRVEPSRDRDPGLTDAYYNFGVAIPVTRGVRIALAYKSERLKNGTTINTRARELGAWGEIKW